MRAIKTVTLVSIIFWIFSYSPSGTVESSLLYKVGTAIEPVTKFFGLGWQTFMALSTTYRESHSLKWTVRTAAFYVGAALILSCIVYHVSALFIS